MHSFLSYQILFLWTVTAAEINSSSIVLLAITVPCYILQNVICYHSMSMKTHTKQQWQKFHVYKAHDNIMFEYQCKNLSSLFLIYTNLAWYLRFSQWWAWRLWPDDASICQTAWYSIPETMILIINLALILINFAHKKWMMGSTLQQASTLSLVSAIKFIGSNRLWYVLGWWRWGRSHIPTFTPPVSDDGFVKDSVTGWFRTSYNQQEKILLITGHVTISCLTLQLSKESESASGQVYFHTLDPQNKQR